MNQLVFSRGMFGVHFNDFVCCRRSQGTCQDGKTRRAHVRSDLLPEESGPTRGHDNVRGTRNPQSSVRSSRDSVQGDPDPRLWSWSHRRSGFTSRNVHSRDERGNRFAG